MGKTLCNVFYYFFNAKNGELILCCDEKCVSVLRSKNIPVSLNLETYHPSGVQVTI